jgi:hypothetical protein
MSMTRLFTLLGLVLLNFTASSEVISPAPSPIENLSTQLRSLISKEMLSLQYAMTAVLPAYVAGDWQKVSDTALNMKHSYILREGLTEEQMKELESKLPASYLKLDQAFHYQASMLSHAADMKKVELVGFYYAELAHSCVACHTQFAQHRFPMLIPKQEYDLSH